MDREEMPYRRERNLAIDAVRRAAHITEAVRATLRVNAMEKEDRSPVTVADFASQAVVCRALAAAFPGDAIVAEEDSAELAAAGREGELDAVVRHVSAEAGGAGAREVRAWIDLGRGDPHRTPARFWTLDPIDGTRGFLRDDQYAIALALIEEGVVRVGVLACPRLDGGRIFAAILGHGAGIAPIEHPGTRLEEPDHAAAHRADAVPPQPAAGLVPLPAAGASHPSALRLVESVESRHGDHERQEAVARVVGLTAPPLRIDSQAKYGVLARGDAALYLRLPSPRTPDYREKIWDHAAGALIVTEAGGSVTDIQGNALRFDLGETLKDNSGITATRGIDHAQVIDALRA